MAFYVLRRILTMIPTLLVISLLTFIIIELPAGDYISNQIAALRAAGESASIAKLEFMRSEFALDRPDFPGQTYAALCSDAIQCALHSAISDTRYIVQ